MANIAEMVASSRESMNSQAVKHSLRNSGRDFAQLAHNALDSAPQPRAGSAPSRPGLS